MNNNFTEANEGNEVDSRPSFPSLPSVKPSSLHVWLAKLQRSWLAANVAGWNGGAVAVKSYIGMATASTAAAQLGVAVPALTLEQAAMVFVCAFAYEFFDYFTRNPLVAP